MKISQCPKSRLFIFIKILSSKDITIINVSFYRRQVARKSTSGLSRYNKDKNTGTQNNNNNNNGSSEMESPGGRYNLRSRQPIKNPTTSIKLVLYDDSDSDWDSDSFSSDWSSDTQELLGN